MLNNNFLATLATFAVALAWLRLNDFIAHRGWVDSHLSRKIIHIGTGPLFVLCWPLFTAAPISRYLAALVPFAITMQFVLVGLGVMRDEAAVKAMSRTGDRREILKGPLFYGIVFVLLTLLYWQDSPIGMTALMLMCGGDGLADIMGRGLKSAHLPWSRGKSWFGSLGMFLGGWALTMLILGIYVLAGAPGFGPFTGYLLPVTMIALVATLVESLPLRDVDNITVTLAAVALGYLVF